MHNNQHNHSQGPHFGQGSHPPIAPAYQPPPPPHYQQGPPPAHVYLHGPPGNVPVHFPPSVMPNTGQAFVFPSQLRGSSMTSQTLSSIGLNNAQHFLNSWAKSQHMLLPPVPPPVLGSSHQETSWALGLPSRVLPPPPLPPSSQGQVLYKPPFHPPPRQPGDMQNLQHSHNTPALLPPSGSAFLAPTTDGAYLHSNVGNFHVPSLTPPPLPSSPPPILPSPPPPTPPVTSASSQAVCCDPNSCKLSVSGLKAADSVVEVAAQPSVLAPVYNSDLNQDSGNYREAGIVDRGAHLSTRSDSSKNFDLPPSPPCPTEEKILHKIEALCCLIAENGPGIEDKIRQNEFQNPEYEFLFGGDPGTEAAISHAYFLWMKKKYNLEHRWHERKSELQLRPLSVDSSGKQCHLHVVATESADSDMEMEDDITLSDKDQGSNCAIGTLTQRQDQVDEVFSMNANRQQLQNSTEKDPSKDIVPCGASCSGSVGVRKQLEGPELLSDLEHSKSARFVTKACGRVNDSTEVAGFPQGMVMGKSSASLDDFTQNDTSFLNEASNCDRDSRQPIRRGSPVRLLEDYSSDDNTSDNEDESCGADANVVTVSTRDASGVSVAQNDFGSYLETGVGSKSPYSTQNGFKLLSKKTFWIDSEASQQSVQELKGTHDRTVMRCTSSHGCVEHDLENKMLVNFESSIEAFRGEEKLCGTGIDSCSKSGTEQENQRKNSKFEPNIPKVDKFGRHLREFPTDSDSDDSSYYQTRRRKKRDRSWSRSRSPLDKRSRRRRTKRSPWRRRNKRSRSHSWSPRHCRSRSRSPIFRRSGDFLGDNVKRDNGQCLDFIQGKCFRGASCRYIHYESDNNAGSRCYRNKHDLEVHSHAKNSGINEGTSNISSKMSDYKQDGVRSQDVDIYRSVTSQALQHRKENSFGHAVVSTTSGLDGKSANNDPVESESSKKVAPEVQETLVVEEEPKTSVHDNGNSQKAVNFHQQHLVDGFQPEALISVDVLKPYGCTYKNAIPSEDGSFMQQIQSNISAGGLEHSVHMSQLRNASIVSDSSVDKRSMVSVVVSNVSGGEPLPYMLPSTQQQSALSSAGLWQSPEQPSLHSLASKEVCPHSISSGELPLHKLPPPPPPVFSRSLGESVVQMPQIPRDSGVVQQSTTKGKFEPYPAPLHTMDSHFSVLPMSSRASFLLPPPSSPVYNTGLSLGAGKSYVSPECNQSHLHARNDFVSYTFMKPTLLSHSQSSEFQDEAYTSLQDCSRTFMLTEALSPKHWPQGNPASHLLSGPNLCKDDCSKQLPMQGSIIPSSTSFGSLHPQPKQLSLDLDANRLQPYFDSKLPPQEHFKTTNCINPSTQKQQSIYNFQGSAYETNLGLPGKSLALSKYPPDIQDSNHSTSVTTFGGSRISAHYNPYASTFDQPLSSIFSSNIYRQENDIIHGSSYGLSRLNHTSTSREGVRDGGGTRQSASSPKFASAVGLVLPRSGGDQYDPLFDSIEPSSSSLKKLNSNQKQEVTGESNISLRPENYKSLDVEETNKHGKVGAVASTSSQNNNEYGETGDAEVGAVENETLSNHMDIANMTTGDVEINQLKSPGKRKKSKDSRSMKLFKVSIANFVKEVLKPSWRQGNMSKVAFKTIVKKTVDKVSGAMKGHRVPKSQAKISQYIDSSQRKLTKLVMGYVDRYVKV